MYTTVILSCGDSVPCPWGIGATPEEALAAALSQGEPLEAGEEIRVLDEDGDYVDGYSVVG